MVKSAQTVTVVFSTSNPTSGAAADATGTPTGTLYVNGTANGATVTVTNITTGLYKAALTLPSLSAGDVVSLRVSATVAAVAGEGVVWQDVGDTVRMSDTLVANPATGGIVSGSFAAGAINAAAIASDAITDAKVASDVTIASVTGAVGSVTAGVTLAASAVQAIWDAATSALTTVGSIGKWILDKLDVVLSTRLAGSGYTAPPTAAANASQVRTELTTELGRIDVAISTRLATAGYTAPPSAAANASATLDALTADHIGAGTIGHAINAAGAAGDPLSSNVPGSYAAGSAGYVLGNLPDRTVNVVSPILSGQDLEFNHGFDYLAADGRSEDVTVSTWPTLTGATVVLKFGGLTWSVVSVTAATTICIAVPRARWADIALSEGTIQYGYVIQATLTNGDIVDLMTGTLRVTKL